MEVIGQDRKGLLADVEKSKRQKYVPRGRRFDLVHKGRPSESAMEARLDAFLFKNRALIEQRETAELTASIIRSRGWNR